MTLLLSVEVGAVTNKIEDGFIYDENVLIQNEDVFGNILALIKENDNYVFHFIEYRHKNFDDYEYYDKIKYSISSYDKAMTEYKRLFDIWNEPEVKSLEEYI